MTMSILLSHAALDRRGRDSIFIILTRFQDAKKGNLLAQLCARMENLERGREFSR